MKKVTMLFTSLLFCFGTLSASPDGDRAIDALRKAY
jgi:hypothetical protein